MPLYDFKGPVTRNNTRIYTKTAGVTAAANLVKSVTDAADADARWTAIKTWAGADDGDVTRYPGVIADFPGLHAPANVINTEVYDGDGQTRQSFGIAQTPELAITIALFDPSDAAHAALAAIKNGTYLDLLHITATSWFAADTVHLDGTKLAGGGTVALLQAGQGYDPGGAAGENIQWTLPVALRGIYPDRVVASY